MRTTKKPNSQSQLACAAGARQVRGRDHDEIGDRSRKHPYRHLGDGDRLFLAFACDAQNATTSGVKAKIMNGLKAWNQVDGISQSRRPGMSRRSVLDPAQRCDGVALLLVGRPEERHRARNRTISAMTALPISRCERLSASSARCFRARSRQAARFSGASR